MLVACPRIQPTLSPTDRDLSLYAQSLGWSRLMTWMALEQSTTVQAPISTGPALTQRLLHALGEMGLIELGGAGPSTRRALYEPLVWRYRLDVGPPRALPALIQGALTSLAANPAVKEHQRELWESLVDAEVESYLVHLLKRHAMDPLRATDIVSTMAPEWEMHTLARRRYLAWYGVRGASAALLRSDFDQEAAHRAMLEEMRRRSRWLAGRQGSGTLPPEDYCFMPEPHWKRPILVDLLAGAVLPSPATYWTVHPSTFFDVARTRA